MCSARSPGLPDLLGLQMPGNAVVVGVITSDPSSTALPDTAGAQVPCFVHDIREFYRRESAKLTDLGLRPDYDAATARILRELDAEVVVLCGYLHILTAPVLDLFPNRLINIHDSDLLVTGEDGLPRYRGLRSTRDAILAGEPETRSTIHLVRPAVDVGPALLRSWSFPVHRLAVDAVEWNAAPLLKAYAYAQREWMMRAAWGRMLLSALRMVADDRVRVSGENVFIGGISGPTTLAHPRGHGEPRWAGQR
jgi:folate-dependent phosphoribosylglycinamide formyltransferase PurN